VAEFTEEDYVFKPDDFKAEFSKPPGKAVRLYDERGNEIEPEDLSKYPFAEWIPEVKIILTDEDDHG